MNTIEMQSITALAHLNSCVLYFMDLSEQCGFTIEAQVNDFVLSKKTSLICYFNSASFSIPLNHFSPVNPPSWSSTKLM